MSRRAAVRTAVWLLVSWYLFMGVGALVGQLPLTTANLLVVGGALPAFLLTVIYMSYRFHAARERREQLEGSD